MFDNNGNGLFNQNTYSVLVKMIGVFCGVNTILLGNSRIYKQSSKNISAFFGFTLNVETNKVYLNEGIFFFRSGTK